MILKNLKNEDKFFNFGGYTDFDGEVESFESFEHDEFLGLSKRGKERRQLKRELRESGMSRKEARKLALQMVPRSKKKYMALQTEKNNPPKEVENLQEQGYLSSDNATASSQISQAIDENIAEGTQAVGNTGSPNIAGVGGKGGNMMMWIIGGVVVVGAGWFFFLRK
jgi:hypothetical protein